MEKQIEKHRVTMLMVYLARSQYGNESQVKAIAWRENRREGNRNEHRRTYLGEIGKEHIGFGVQN